MASYDDIKALKATDATAAAALIRGPVVDQLKTLWLADHRRSAPGAEMVEVETEDFRYLFDLAGERLIAGFGFVGDLRHQARDAARMKGFPRPGPDRIKGHAVAHQLGGGLDINLVAQNRTVNAGAFRKLEGEAARHPGCLYFTQWLYACVADQTPCSVVQGLIRIRTPTEAGGADNNLLVVKVVRHPN